jgi:iron complex transport system permease protein
MKRSYLYLFSFVLLVILFILSLQIGVIHLQTPLIKLIGKNSGVDATTVWQIRFPRAMGALLVGAALGVAGAIAQGIFRNPLAEPALIGLTSGATLGTIAVISTGVAEFGSRTNVESAILFGALSAFLIYFLAPQKGFGFLITGIAISATLTAIAGVMISISSKPGVQAISFWNFGSLALLNSQIIKVIAPFIEVGFILALFVSRKLDIYSLGDNSARFMGINPKAVRVWAIITLAFLIGPSVSAVGAIAFVGLLVPHIVRLLIGPSHRKMVGLSAIIGADLLLLADLLARTIFQPHEIPLGLITSLIGAPVLILLLRTKNAMWVSHD